MTRKAGSPAFLFAFMAKLDTTSTNKDDTELNSDEEALKGASQSSDEIVGYDWETGEYFLLKIF
jgi:hypothetical protein